MERENLLNYVLRLADSPLILGQRLTEWCGHGPILEQDIALSNIALDLLGEARNFYQYAASIKGGDATEDTFAMTRLEGAYKNFLICELPNGDFAQTVLRQFFFDNYHSLLFQELAKSSDERIAAIAEKSAKEVAYHLRYSSEWVIRLGDGTAESHERMNKALRIVWPYTGELLTSDALDQWALDQGIGADISLFAAPWMTKTKEIFSEATLTVPEQGWIQSGGKAGKHTEHFGHLIAELQMMQRTYPNMTW